MSYYGHMSAAEALPEPSKAPRSPAEQGSEVPLGWKPTPREPVPVVRCIQIKKDGNRCKAWSIRGYDKCFKHSGPGALMPNGNVNKYAASVVEAARLRLVDSADMALDVIHDLYSNPGTSEGIRLKAATEILDRAGIRGGYEVDVTVEERESPTVELKKRMLELKKGAEARQRMQDGTYDDELDIVEGEIVSEDEPLFELEEEDDDERE